MSVTRTLYRPAMIRATEEDETLEDRCAPRSLVRIPASLRRSGSHAFSVVVRDLSIAGFACEAVTSLPKNAICWLTLPGLAGLQAEVVWNDGRIVGCSFASILNQAVLDRLLAMHRQ